MRNDSFAPEAKRFALGALYLTASADRVLAPLDVSLALGRHSRGDWGELCPEDKFANDSALESGARLLSAYRDRNGTKFWIITEADRRATTILLPEDY